MSDIIEENLKEIYCNLELEVEKQIKTWQDYEIRIRIDWNKGFKFIYTWNEKLTVDSNIEEVKKIIDKLLIKYFKKVRE